MVSTELIINVYTKHFILDHYFWITTVRQKYKVGPIYLQFGEKLIEICKAGGMGGFGGGLSGSFRFFLKRFAL